MITTKISKRCLSTQLLDYDIFRPKAPKGTDPVPLSAKPPILFLHGLLGHRKNNRTASRMLANQLNTTLIVPDLRNHGTSFHAAPHNYKAMSDDLTNLIDHLNGDVDFDRGVIVMGHSMGGKVALVHALRYPELVKGAISIDNVPYMNPKGSYGEFEKFHMALRHMQFKVDSGCSSVKEVADSLIKYIDHNKKVVSFLVNNLYKSPVSKKVESYIPMALINEYIEELLEFKMEESGDLDSYSAFHGPTLIIRANFSPFIGHEIHEHLIREHFDNYEIKAMDSGHWIVTENRVPFVKMVTSWVSEKFA